MPLDRERDKHITRSGDDYVTPFEQLLPQGIAWPRNSDSTLMKLVKGLSQIWGHVEIRASDLLERESDPRIAIELLPDWERNWGLPDLCYYDPDNPQSIGDRQKALIQRMTIEGAQSREFFIAQAAYIGYKITITEYRPFIVGIDRVGDNRQIGFNNNLQRDQFGNPLRTTIGTTPVQDGALSEYPYILGPPENRYYWTVHVAEARLTWFRVGGGGGQTGVDPHLRIGLALDLECLLNRWKPAHTQIIFDYSGLATGGEMAGTGALPVFNFTIQSANLHMSQETILTATIVSSSFSLVAASANLVLSGTSPTVTNSGKPFSLRDWPTPKGPRPVMPQRNMKRTIG